jgi:hypothetical protein
MEPVFGAGRQRGVDYKSQFANGIDIAITSHRKQVPFDTFVQFKRFGSLQSNFSR